VRLAPAIGLAGALALAALAYGLEVDGDFHYDDWTTIQVNWALRAPGQLVRHATPLTLLGPERPITNLSLALDFARGGAKPYDFHVTSLVLHLVSAVLAFALLRGVARRAGAAAPDALAAVAAGAFALHPMQAEAVAYAAQRSEVLSGLLGLAALLALDAAVGAAGRWRAAGFSALGAVLHLLALGAKAVAVTVPVSFVLLWLVGGPGAEPLGRRVRCALLVSAPCWLLSLASVARNLSRLGPGDTAGLGAGLGPWRYLLTEVPVHWGYLRRFAWPTGFSVDPVVASLAEVGWPLLVLASAGLVVLLALATTTLLASEGRVGPGAVAARLIGMGVLWWFVQLAPTSSVIPIDDPMAEHRPYLALLGLGLAAAALAGLALARWRPGRPLEATSLAAAAALLLAGLAHERARIWSSDLALWDEALRANPGSSRALANRAHARQQAHDLVGALADYQAALAQAPSPRLAAIVGLNMSATYLDQGRPDLALSTVDWATGLGGQGVGLLHNRANALRLTGRLREAHEAALAAVTAVPDDPDLHDTLGLTLCALGRQVEGLAEFRAARAIEERLAYSLHEAVTLGALDRREEACQAWRRARTLGAIPRGLSGLPRELGCP
jgi:Tfp pilus assembly protein PilF